MKTACKRRNNDRDGNGHGRGGSRAAALSMLLPVALGFAWMPPGMANAGAATTAPVSRPPTVLVNNSMLLAFQVRPDGIEWSNFTDVAAKRDLLAADQPFWRLTIEDDKGTKQELDNRTGWRRVSAIGGGSWLSMTWQGSNVLASGTLEVRCDVVLDAAQTTWRLVVDNNTSATIRNILFPHVVTRPLGGGSDDVVVYPAASGQRRTDPFANPVGYSGDYPSGWCSYQFLTHYDRTGGVYVATHDPVASTKQIEARTLDDKKSLRLAFNWAAPNATLPGNDFDMPGAAIVQVMRGDWFDAAQIYKTWARKGAAWWPRDERRGDVPRWMHDVAIWAQTGGTTQSVVGRVREFAEYMGVPTALHWYNWHTIPFDNDYPHYFPPKPGFRDGVRELQEAGVRVMPYINGRLWDTDLEDFATTARPFATKNEKGEPYIEEYGSGQKLAPMCPTTPLWQDKVSEIVLRLLGPECGVDGVYIDQVAAARPRLCFDRTHGHPLAGGFWWTTQGYWPMLARLRAEMKKRDPQKMITTECNAEPYVHLFDGYLTWHFQYQNQLPVFAAIYGGRVQLFGRAYRGGPTRDLALRMKAAQSLVFGEQIGWCSPDVIREKDNGPFLRRMARLRHALRDYLADGDMMRPPPIAGDIPPVTADWQWQKEWPITDLAVQAGAWRAPDGRVALIFANVTTGTIAFDLNFDGSKYGFDADALLLTRRTENGPETSRKVALTFRRPVGLGPLEALAYEVAPAKEE